ncbi:CLUMA_CG006623, isoform A [Clunio marinus]|uniref:CLUMA_CG006623, isoform A n=1 Tax=Clunio marinus TaxID=568069 RepID=A0A1J1HYJ7_9DIPT|nr:CLUMA_CG006623, isoform A [Clunio marinus]
MSLYPSHSRTRLVPHPTNVFMMMMETQMGNCSSETHLFQAEVSKLHPASGSWFEPGANKLDDKSTLSQ